MDSLREAREELVQERNSLSVVGTALSEQRRFEHLEAEVRQIVSALKAGQDALGDKASRSLVA